MKKNFVMILGCVAAFISCKKNNPALVPTTTRTNAKMQAAHRDSTAYGSRFISMSLANTMINSYLSSINSPNNDSDLRSFSVNADSLRSYLSDNSIRNVKLMFGHSMYWIESGNNGLYSGYQSGGLTIIIAAYDSAGNYVYHSGGAGACVLDYSAPCPHVCDVNGSASSDVLQ